MTPRATAPRHPGSADPDPGSESEPAPGPRSRIGSDSGSASGTGHDSSAESATSPVGPPRARPRRQRGQRQQRQPQQPRQQPRRQPRRVWTVRTPPSDMSRLQHVDLVGELTMSLCRDAGHFAALFDEWEALRSRSRASTPFQSHAWLYSWWQSYGLPGRLRIVLVRDGGRLVAAAPLMLLYRPLPTLVTLGGRISDYQDVLIDDDCAQAPIALAGALYEAARGAVVDLRQARPGAAAERLHAVWPGPARRLRDSVCLELPGVPMEELLQRLSASSARHTRRKLRRIDALGIEERVVEAREVPDAVRTMLRLHERQWRGRGITSEHLRPRFAAHLVCATRRLADSGDAAVTEYLLDGEVVACDISFTSTDRVCGYLYGADPRLREKRVDITTMLLRNDVRYAFDTGRGTVSLLRGTEPHKLRWRPVPVANGRYVLARRELAAGTAAVGALTVARQRAAAGAELTRRTAQRFGGLVKRHRARRRTKPAGSAESGGSSREARAAKRARSAQSSRSERGGQGANSADGAKDRRA
jgi:hypothetical protein